MLDGPAEQLAGKIKIVGLLQVHPEVRAGAEVLSPPTQPCAWPIRPVHPGEILADELKEVGLSAAELARTLSVPPNRISQIVAIDHLDVFGATGSLQPLEADAPPRVDSEAVLVFPVARESLEAIAPQLPQVPQVGRRFENAQAPLGLTAEALERGNPFAFSEKPGSPVLVAANQTPA